MSFPSEKVKGEKLYITVAFLLLALSASAQVKLGVKAGVNLVQFSNDREFLDAKYRSGFFVGPTLRADLPSYLGADVSLVFDQRSANVTNEFFGEEQHLTRNTLNIPLNVRFYVVNTSFVDLFVKAGPQYCVYLGDKTFSDVAENYRKEWEDSELSVNVGAGFTISKSLELSANYNFYCGKKNDTSWADIFEKTKESIKHDIKKQAWQISAVYYF